ncbi:MAG: SURF1 family protein [Rhodoferax sp.]|nr:SURF1 family protein [Rhodoferax sp.]
MHLNVRFWLLTVAALAGMGVTAALGRWQLDRAAQKQALQAAIDAQARLPVLDGASLAVPAGAPVDTSAVLHRRVLLQGQWLPQYTLFLDNRQMQGRPGFFVITPLQLEGSAWVVWVQRGWVPRNFQDRTQLAPIETPLGRVQVAGRVALPPSALFELGGDTRTEGASRIRQNLDLARFRVETGLQVADVAVLQTGPASEGLQRDWPVVRTGVEKHHGYAFQWFGLSSLIALLYVWFQFVRPFLQARSRTVP